jgi:hypothetical protein
LPENQIVNKCIRPMEIEKHLDRRMNHPEDHLEH